MNRWRCLFCKTEIDVPLEARPPPHSCLVPSWASMTWTLTEVSTPSPTGDGDQQVSYLVERYGGRLAIFASSPGAPPTIAAWIPPEALPPQGSP